MALNYFFVLYLKLSRQINAKVYFLRHTNYLLFL